MDFILNIDVPDLKKGESFYTSAFALTPARRIEGGVELVGGPCPLWLLEKRAGSTAAPGAARDYGRHWTPAHLDFFVDNVEAAVERAIKAGATLEDPPTVHAWGEIAVLADPFGHGFCLVRLIGRGYDEIAT